jgi:hypothetical protein
VSSLGRVRRLEKWAALLFVASRFISGEYDRECRCSSPMGGSREP